MHRRKFSVESNFSKQRKKQQINNRYIHVRQVKSQLDNHDQNYPSLKNTIGIKLSMHKMDEKNNLSIINSQKSVSTNFNHKNKIAIQRKFYSMAQRKTKKKNFNIHDYVSISTDNNKILSLSQIVTQYCSKNRPQQVLPSQFAKLDKLYKQNCANSLFDQCFDVLVKLMNYTIDMGNMICFLKVLRTMGNFYQILEEEKYSMRLFSELMQASILVKNYYYLVIALLGISKCCSNSKLFKQSVRIAKKALQYSWFLNNSQLQLKSYDELGQKYYKMGELETAALYHRKFSNSIFEELDSPLRVFSKYQIEIQQSNNLAFVYDQMSPVFLAHFDLPYRNCSEVPVIFSSYNRDKIIFNKKYEMQPYDVEFQTKKVLKHWIFKIQLEEPNLQNVKMSEGKKTLKSSQSIEEKIHLNAYFKEKGAKFHPRASFYKKEQIMFKKKMSLDQKIRQFISQPGLQKNWYEKIVKKVQAQQKNSGGPINDPVRITKSYSHLNSKKESLKVIFDKTIQFILSKSVKNNHL